MILEIKIEVRVERGDPFELPPHAILERFDFLSWRARNDRENRVAPANVKVHAVKWSAQKEQCGQPSLPARPEHEVIDDELAFVAE